MATTKDTSVNNGNPAETQDLGEQLQLLSPSDEAQPGNERNRCSEGGQNDPSGETSNTLGSSCCKNISVFSSSLVSTMVQKHPLAVTRVLVFLVLLILILIIALIIVALRHEQGCRPEHPHVPSAPCDPCPGNDWIFSLGKCYFFSEEEKDWNSSKAFCLSHNSSLAKIEKERPKEKAFLKRQIGKEAFWIGLTRRNDKSWEWEDGEDARLDVIGDGSSCACLNDPKDIEASSSKCSQKHRWICISEPLKNTKAILKKDGV
ncbi:uncharacterized protein LOC110071027 isoform X1 [Pogona vitticeps]